MPILGPGEHLVSDRLGDCDPYWWVEADGVHYEAFAGDAIRAYPASRRRLDPVSVLALLSFEHLALDRTMVQGLLRRPWLGEVDSLGMQRFAAAPAHGHRVESAPQIAGRFLDAALDELRGYLAGPEQRVFVLLSGGMDSRVFAAMLRRLELDGELTRPVCAVTWGIDGCRDVLYARRLADMFGWEWCHASLDEAWYWRNFELAATRLGAEVDPKHLHRMNWFADVAEPSLVLAASYGDSVGRAEFGGVHVRRVAPLRPHDRNQLMDRRVRAYAAELLHDEVRELRWRHGARSEMGHREIERQAHYMRRELQHTMCVINQYGHRLEQAFVTWPVFELMWGYDARCRTDAIYAEVLRLLDPALLDLAWARTGTRYDTGEGSADDASKQLHRYGYWLRTAHADKLGELCFGPTLAALQTFDLDQVRWMYDDWRREEAEFETLLCTQLSALATIALFAQTFDIGPPRIEALPPPPPIGALHSTWARVSQSARRVSRPLRLRAKARLQGR